MTDGTIKCHFAHHNIQKLFTTKKCKTQLFHNVSSGKQYTFTSSSLTNSSAQLQWLSIPLHAV